ncbi:hypothetical protein [Tenacibaculum maritimum]
MAKLKVIAYFLSSLSYTKRFCDYEFRIPKENAAPNDDEKFNF